MNRITLQRLALALADHSTARLPVELQQGPEGTLLVAGTSRWCRYLPERFFGGPAPHRRLLGHVPVWCLPKVMERWLPRVDLAIARVTVLTVTPSRSASARCVGSLSPYFRRVAAMSSASWATIAM